MIGDIKKLIEASPFEPFLIRTADGHEFSVPHPDHVALMKTRVVITNDNDDYSILPGLLMSSIEVKRGARSRK
jgi:hypothetical protein